MPATIDPSAPNTELSPAPSIGAREIGGTERWGQTWVTTLGAVNLAALIAAAVLSYGLAPAVPLRAGEPHGVAAYDALARALAWMGAAAGQWLRGHSALAQPTGFWLAYVGPLAVSTIAFLALLSGLARHRGRLDPALPQQMGRWATFFAAAAALTLPVVVTDFWLSVAWGRMAADGLNPYYMDIPARYYARVPLETYTNFRMTYGPLWAAVSTVVAWVSGGSVVIAALLFKLLLAGAWIGAVQLVRRLLASHSIHRQCVGLAVVGWLPLSVRESVAEGHNDVVMVALLLLWLYALAQNRGVRASLSLAASALVKYVSAPLFLLDAAHAFHASGRRPVAFIRAYVPRALAAAALGAAVLALFYRGGDFFSAATAMRNWRFYAPDDAILVLGRRLGMRVSWERWLDDIVFVGAAALLVARYLLRPTREHLWAATLGVLSWVVFVFVGHTWPWFVVWVLAIAALVPASLLGRWAIGAALASPIPILIHTIYPSWSRYEAVKKPALPLYLFVLAWVLLAPRSWFAADAATSAASDVDAVPASAQGAAST